MSRRCGFSIAKSITQRRLARPIAAEHMWWNGRTRSIIDSLGSNLLTRQGTQVFHRNDNSGNAAVFLESRVLGDGTRRNQQPGRCYSFDGVNDAINLGARTMASTFTIAMWFKPGAASDTAGLWSNTSSAFDGFVLAQLGTQYRLMFSTYLYTSVDVVVGEWVHLCVTYDGTTATFCTDGVERIDSSEMVYAAPANREEYVGRFYIGSAANGPLGEIFDVRRWDRALSAAEITSIAAHEVLGDELYLLKCDEGDGTTAYDSSGNGNDGTITNATLSTFHDETENTDYSFQNRIGFSESGGILIPRDESDTSRDVQGGSLDHSGAVPRDILLTGMPCLTLDGVDDYIDAAHLTGSETVVRSGGTSTPTISAGRINFTAGTCWDLLLSDGTHYPLCESGGATLHDVSGNGNDGTLTNAVLATAWSATQDEYDYLVSNGWSGTSIPYDPTGSDIPAGSIPDSYTVDLSGGVATPVADTLGLSTVSPPDFDTLDAVSPVDTKFGRDQDGYGDRLIVVEEALTGSDKTALLEYVGQ